MQNYTYFEANNINIIIQIISLQVFILEDAGICLAFSFTSCYKKMERESSLLSSNIDPSGDSQLETFALSDNASTGVGSPN